MKKLLDVSEYRVQLNVKNLFLFFFYHFFYFAAAPLTLLILLLAYGNGLSKNMVFFPQMRPAFFIQFFSWLALLTLTCIIFVLKPKNCYKLEWASVLLFVIFRCVIVSVRYAFVSKFRL